MSTCDRDDLQIVANVARAIADAAAHRARTRPGTVAHLAARADQAQAALDQYDEPQEDTPPCP